MATARKLVVIIWHLLSRRTEYRFGSPTRIAEMRRRMELVAGAPRSRTRATTSRPRAERLQTERGVLLEAERAYRKLVRERSRSRKQGAAAATGERP